MEIHDLINQELTRAAEIFSALDQVEQSNRAMLRRGKNQRTGLLSEQFRNLRGYGSEMSMVIEPASSDEESCDERCRPSVRDVVEEILDSEMTDITEEYTPSSHHKPTLIFFYLDSRVTRAVFQRIIRKLSPVPIIRSWVVDFSASSSFIHCGIVTYDEIDSATAAYTYFRRKEKESKLGGMLHEMPGIHKQGIVRWFWNRWADPENRWSAIVIRNLEKNATKEYVQAWLNEYNVKYVERPRILKTQLCTIVVLQGIEDAERACIKLNGRQISPDQSIRVHIHPMSNQWARPKISHHKFLQRPSRATPKKPEVAQGYAALLESLKAIQRKNSASSIDPKPQIIKPRPSTEEDGEIQEKDRVATPRDCYSVQEFPGCSYTEHLGAFEHQGATVYTVRPPTPRPDLYPPRY